VTMKGGEAGASQGADRREPAGERRPIESASERPMNTPAMDMVIRGDRRLRVQGWVCGSVRRQMERSEILPWNEGAGYIVSSIDL
jgi:hypothetical protein